MSGPVLIIDSQSNRRILLRAQLDTAAYAVDLAESSTEAMMRIQEDPPEVVIVADDLPGLRLRQFCKSLRAHNSTQLTTILVAVPRENHSARVSALIAGAHDVIDYSSDAADLKARLRNFMRLRQSSAESGNPAPHPPLTGLAESAPEFLPRTTVTFIAGDNTAKITGLVAGMSNEPDFETQNPSAQTILRTPDPDTDVYVLFETDPTSNTRDLLGALRSHPASRHSRILFVTDTATTTASPLDLGAHDQVPLSVSPTELALRIRRLARRKHDADRSRRTTSELGLKAYTDSLTKLNNREAMTEYLLKTDQALAEHRRPLAVLIADVDHFKSINDNHGHPAGDIILAHIASLMKSKLRERDFIARYGGEEFLMVLPDVDPEQAHNVAHRLRDTVAANPKSVQDGTHVRATISIGVAFAGCRDRLSTEDLILAADSALLAAKRNGRNRIEVAPHKASTEDTADPGGPTMQIVR